MRCPSGIMGSRIFFIAINTLLVVNWGMQLNEEARIEGEIGYWGSVVEFLEREKERVEGLMAEEAESQLHLESFASPSQDHDRLREEDQIPPIPSTIARRVIRPASSAVPATPSNLKSSDAGMELRKAVIDPDSLMDLKKTAPAKMTVGRKAGLRMREERSRLGDDEEAEGEESD